MSMLHDVMDHFLSNADAGSVWVIQIKEKIS